MNTSKLIINKILKYEIKREKEKKKKNMED